jgi:Fur family ferric uptake transcriptional regulator
MSCNAEVDLAIRGSGLRRTMPRSLVLSAIRHEGGHVSAYGVAERIAREHPEADVALSTVYRALEQLAERGLISALRLPSRETRYEWVGGDEEHHHLVCRQCGETAELTPDALDEVTEQITRRTGFAVELRHLALGGLCAACAAEAGSQG